MLCTADENVTKQFGSLDSSNWATFGWAAEQRLSSGISFTDFDLMHKAVGAINDAGRQC